MGMVTQQHAIQRLQYLLEGNALNADSVLLSRLQQPQLGQYAVASHLFCFSRLLHPCKQDTRSVPHHHISVKLQASAFRIIIVLRAASVGPKLYSCNLCKCQCKMTLALLHEDYFASSDFHFTQMRTSEDMYWQNRSAGSTLHTLAWHHIQ
jgi:hypothetical protein